MAGIQTTAPWKVSLSGVGLLLQKLIQFLTMPWSNGEPFGYFFLTASASVRPREMYSTWVDKRCTQNTMHTMRNKQQDQNTALWGRGEHSM